MHASVKVTKRITDNEIQLLNIAVHNISLAAFNCKVTRSEMVSYVLDKYGIDSYYYPL